MPLYKKIDKNSIRPKLRFEHFNNSWIWTNGDYIFESISNKNHSSDLPILAITQDFGAIPRELIDFNISVTNQSVSTYKVVEIGDFIISLRSFQGGIELSKYKGICSPAYIVLKNKREINSDFFKFYLKTKNYITNLTQNLEGIRDGKMISFKYFSEVGLIFPSLPEQQKIANFLTAIDTQIQTLEKKKNLLKLYKKGVLQKIFKQELRFEDGSDKSFSNWKEKKLGDLIVEYKKKSTVNNQYPVLTSSKRGLMLQSEYYSDDNPISERDNLGFNILPEEYITYRSRSDNRSFNFNLNSLGFTGVISVYYPVFKVENCNNYFLITLLNYYKSKIGKYSVGTSQTVLSINELKKMKFFVPSLEEQIKIANFLSAIDKNIAFINTKIEQTKVYKKGLLQQMFV